MRYYVRHLQIVAFFLLNVVSIAQNKLKDFVNDKMQQVYNRTSGSIPIEIYIGYSHDPWGEIQHVKQREETETHITNNDNNRSRRSVLQLYSMVVCATGCNPLLYKGYGCYCGFLGSGYPVDPIDRCCKMHDWCYDRANCPVFLEYFIPYVWTCYMRQPLCSIGESCSQRLCECDRRLAECLRRYQCPLNKAVCTSSPWRNYK